MKKLLLLFLGLSTLFMTACGNMEDTPSKAVEEFLGKYQGMDQTVLTQLDDIVESEATLNDDQKKEYKSLMEKQYQNLSYKIKDENVDGDNATVDVEVEVFDYATALDKAQEYYDNNNDEFLDDEGNLDDSKYMDYRIKEMNNVADKKKEEITFNLEKEDGKWKVQNLSEIDLQRIHGLYK